MGTQRERAHSARSLYLLLNTCFAALLLVLTACGGEDAERAASGRQVTPGAPHASSSQGEIKLSLSADADDTELKGAINYTIGIAQKFQKQLSAGQTIKALCILRSDKKDALGNYEDTPTIFPVDFTVEPLYSNFVLKAEATVTINDYAKFIANDPSRKWYIRAIISDPTTWEQVAGQYTGKINMTVPRDPADGNIAYIEALSETYRPNATRLNIPYASAWTEVEVRTDGPTDRFGGALSRMRFYPQGTVLRLMPGTTLPDDNFSPSSTISTHSIRAIKLTSQSFSPEGYFDLSATTPADTDIAFTHSTASTWSETYRLFSPGGAPYGVPAHPTWFLPLWVMPRPESQQVIGEAGLKIETQIHAIGNTLIWMPNTYNSRYLRQDLSGTDAYHASRTPYANQGLKKKLVKNAVTGRIPSTYFVRFRLTRPRMPLDLLSSGILMHKRIVDGGVQKGVLGNTESSLGLTGFQGLFRDTELTNPQFIPAGMHVPTYREMYAVFGSQAFNILNYNEVYNNVNEDVYLDGAVRTGTGESDWRSANISIVPTSSHYVRYGIRFKNMEGGKYRSAYRVSVTKSHLYSGGISEDFIFFQVESVYLGPYVNLNINQLTNETQWNALRDKVQRHYSHNVSVHYVNTSRYLFGFYDGVDSPTADATTVQRKYNGQAGVFWISNPGGGVWMNYHMRTDNGAMGLYQENNRTSRLFPVLLFHDDN